MEKKAIVVKRDSSRIGGTEEIRRLADAAGYTVVDEITQIREEDAEYHIGSGKLHDVNIKAIEYGVDAIIFGDELTPYQRYNIGIYVPDTVVVHDNYTIVLESFEQRAKTKEAQLQLRLAKLRYELPRAEVKTRLSKRSERPGFMGLGEYQESQEEDIKNQIARTKKELDSYYEEREERRTQRREAGYNLIAIAGYTNAGKSMLFRRLGDKTSVDMNIGKHDDLSTTAESEEKWFTTLDTTVRELDHERRKALITDTVGFITELPDWLVDSFRPTFSSIYEADLVLLTVDGTLPIDEMHERIVASKDFVFSNADDAKPVITVINKIDQIPKAERKEKKDALEELVPNMLFVSAKTGENIEKLKTKINNSLPPLEKENFTIDLSDNTAMKFISWLHNNTYIISKEYNNSTASLTIEASEEMVEKARGRARKNNSVHPNKIVADD